MKVRDCRHRLLSRFTDKHYCQIDNRICEKTYCQIRKDYIEANKEPKPVSS